MKSAEWYFEVFVNKLEQGQDQWASYFLKRFNEVLRKEKGHAFSA